MGGAGRGVTDATPGGGTGVSYGASDLEQPTSEPLEDPVPAAARWFRVIAFVEAVSWTLLLIAMFLKYVVETETPHEGGVPIAGPIHGAAFVVYLLSAVWAARTMKWRLGTVALALAASIPPLFTIVFERWAHRTGRLGVTTRSRRTTPAAGAPSRG